MSVVGVNYHGWQELTITTASDPTVTRSQWHNVAPEYGTHLSTSCDPATPVALTPAHTG